MAIRLTDRLAREKSAIVGRTCRCMCKCSDPRLCRTAAQIEARQGYDLSTEVGRERYAHYLRTCTHEELTRVADAQHLLQQDPLGVRTADKWAPLRLRMICAEADSRPEAAAQAARRAAWTREAHQQLTATPLLARVRAALHLPHRLEAQ